MIIFDVICLIVVGSILGLILSVFVPYLNSVNKNFRRETDNRSRQKKIQGNMQDYRCNNEGESLNDCEIYPVPYNAIGYRDVI